MDPFAVFGPNSINGLTCTSFLIYVRSGAVLDVYWAEGLSREPRLVHIGSKDRSARCSRSTPDQRIDPRVVLDPFWIKASSVSFLGSEDVTGLDDPHAAFDSCQPADRDADSRDGGGAASGFGPRTASRFHGHRRSPRNR